MIYSCPLLLPNSPFLPSPPYPPNFVFCFPSMPVWKFFKQDRHSVHYVLTKLLNVLGEGCVTWLQFMHVAATWFMWQVLSTDIHNHPVRSHRGKKILMVERWNNYSCSEKTYLGVTGTDVSIAGFTVLLALWQRLLVAYWTSTLPYVLRYETSVLCWINCHVEWGHFLMFFIVRDSIGQSSPQWRVGSKFNVWWDMRASGMNC